MVTEEELRACKKKLEAIKGCSTEQELRDRLISVMDEMTYLYQCMYREWLDGYKNNRNFEYFDKFIHYYEIKMATIAILADEAKKRG